MMYKSIVAYLGELKLKAMISIHLFKQAITNRIAEFMGPRMVIKNERIVFPIDRIAPINAGSGYWLTRFFEDQHFSIQWAIQDAQQNLSSPVAAIWLSDDRVVYYWKSICEYSPRALVWMGRFAPVIVTTYRAECKIVDGNLEHTSTPTYSIVMDSGASSVLDTLERYIEI